MKWFYNMKINKKLITSFIIVALIAGTIGAIGIVNVINIDNMNTQMYEVNTAPLGDLAEAAVAFQRTRVNVLAFLNDVEGEESAAFIRRMNEFKVIVAEELSYVRESAVDPYVRSRVELLENLLVDHYQIQEEIINLANLGEVEEARALVAGIGADSARRVDEIFGEILHLKISQAELSSNQSTASTRTTITSMSIFAIIALLLSIIFGWYIARVISKPLKSLGEVACKMAEGDIDVQVDIDTKDEVGELAKSFKAMIENIQAQASALEKIAQGEQNIDIQLSSEKDFLGQKLQVTVKQINGITEELGMLTKAAKNGKLDVRANSNTFEGSWKEILDGFNETLDAVIEPVEEASYVLQQMAQGNLKAKVKGQYKGDHAKIKEALNSMSDTLSSYVDEINHVLTEMAKGNLKVEINQTFVGDFIDIQKAIEYILNSFNLVLGEIQVAMEQVASGAKQVSDASQSLSQASTEQASSIEEVTASMNEVAGQTKENALSANEASELSQAVKVNAIKGNEEMAEMLSAMEEINQSSNNISKIIKVIDEIAFQTNILALNAAVEAARAGDHGKGFAVVAEEVRNLAARSAKAAKETTTMIENSIKKAETGTKIANGTAKALNDIVEEVTKAVTVISNIADASNAQATAVTQINQAIEQVSQVIQMNTATAEESASASEELSSQSDIVEDMIQRFRLKKSAVNNIGQTRNKMQVEELVADDTVGKLKDVTPINISLDDSDFGKY